MPIMIEEYHVTVYAPRRLPDRDYLAMRRVLNSDRFRRALHRAVVRIVRERRQLDRVRITISQ